MAWIRGSLQRLIFWAEGLQCRISTTPICLKLMQELRKGLFKVQLIRFLLHFLMETLITDFYVLKVYEADLITRQDSKNNKQK